MKYTLKHSILIAILFGKELLKPITDLSKDLRATIMAMVEEGLLAITGASLLLEIPNWNDLVVTPEGHKYISPDTKTRQKQTRKKADETGISEFVESFRAIFPKGRNGGNRAFKGDLNGCILKMYAFLKQFPNIPRHEILAATEHFVATTDKPFITSADYFINKTGTSRLLEEITYLRENGPKKSGDTGRIIDLL